MQSNLARKLIACLLASVMTPNLSASTNSCLRLLTPPAEFEIEAAFQAAFKRQAEEDRAYLEQLEKHPSQTSLQHRNEILREEKEWVAAKKRGNYYNQRKEKRYRPILERIAGDLLQRQTRKYGEKHIEELKRLRKKAWDLLLDGDPPYKATARFIMLEYLPMLDKLLIERHPHLAGKDRYHRRHAEHLLEDFLNKSPDVYLHFSFEALDDRFFVNSRPSLVNVIGIDLRGLDDVSLEPKTVDGPEKSPRVPFADNFEMLISEFAWHDLGHAEFTILRDLEFLRKSGLPVDRIVAEWESTNKAVMAMVDQVYRNGDKDLGDAMTNLLFEIARERGYQFSLTVLKQELDTPKWSEVIIERKLKAGFYSHYPSNEKRYARMEEARLGLLRMVGRLKEEAQLRWYDATNHYPDVIQVPVQLGHSPSLIYAHGRMRKIRIRAFDEILVDAISPEGKSVSTPIGEIVGAQVEKTQRSPFSAEIQKQINVVLMMKQKKVDTISHIEVDASRIVQVVLNSGRTVELVELARYMQIHADQISEYENFVASQEVAKKKKKETPPFQLENLQIFKMNQVLGTDDRAELMAYTIRPPTVVYHGHIRFEQNLMTGHYLVHIKPIGEEKEFSLPLMEVRIDPWVHPLTPETSRRKGK